jgi:tetratricopeptide (TPR) repeat protein
MKQSWLRWTVPPSISLLVHAALLAIVAYIGVRISASTEPTERVRVTELSLPAPPSVPEQQQQNESSSEDALPTAQPLPAAPELPDSVQSQAKSLENARPSATPAMDPVTLEAMKEANASIARPESTSPPSVAFAGVQSKAARTLVYVVDGSGATANSFAYLQTQLMRSIDRLSPTQRFQVVLFRESDESPYTLAPINSGRLARATPEHKREVGQWLDTVAARGRSNPVEGLEAALKLKPDLVLLITRSIQRTEMGWAQGQREILQTLNALNPINDRSGQRGTVIKCVQLLDEDPTGIMQAIGGLHGDGSDDYKVVRYEDLVSSDEPEDIVQRSVGASDEQRIATAAQMWSELAQSGSAQSVLTSVADGDQRVQAIDAARAVRSLMGPLREQDGRAELLWAQSTLVLQRAGNLSDSESELRAIVERLGPIMYTDPPTDAQRVITVAMARAELGQREQAIAELDELLGLSADLDLDALTRAQALLALISLGEEPETISELASQPPFTTRSGNIDALWGLLLREGVTISRLNSGDDNAWTPMLRVRQAAAGSRSIVEYIDQRLAMIYTQHAQGAEQPPTAVLMAAADGLSRSIATRGDAIELYEQVVQRSEVETEISDALWQIGVLGRAINTSDAVERSNAALTQLASRAPNDPRAMGAISSAIGASSEDDPDALRARLSLAIENYPQSPAIDLWRLQLAELQDGFARLDTLDPITPATREGVLAGELYEQTVQGMLDHYDDPQVRLGLTRRVQDAARRFGLTSESLWTKRLAISEATQEPEQALSRIDTLIEQAEAANEPSDELRLLRAQTLLRLGQSQSAFETLRELSERIDASGTRTSTYWQSWALMLESIADNGSSSEKREALRHLARLQLIDPELGGSPWRERLQDAAKTLHSDP